MWPLIHPCNIYSHKQIIYYNLTSQSLSPATMALALRRHEGRRKEHQERKDYSEKKKKNEGNTMIWQFFFCERKIGSEIKDTQESKRK